MRTSLYGLVSDDRVLLVQRQHGNFPNRWCLPGGPIRGGVDSWEAATQHMLQNLTLLERDIAHGYLVTTKTLTFTKPMETTVDISVWCMLLHQRPNMMLSGKYKGYGWFTLNEIRQVDVLGSVFGFCQQILGGVKV